MKSTFLTFLLFLLTITLVTSCKDQNFKKIKNPTVEIHSLTGPSAFKKIKSYSLTYNPSADGFITLELENGGKYQAESVSGGSFSSINLLLKEPDVLFDTVRKELFVNKSFQ